MTSMTPTTFELLATICFTLAIVHTFSVKQFQKLGNKYPSGSPGENIFHLLGEVEVVFGIWAGIFIVISSLFINKIETFDYLNSRNFTEAVFVFVIMVVCSTKPILQMVESIIMGIAKLLPVKRSYGIYFSCLVIGPLLGSFITEPAAMTVTALFLLNFFFNQKISEKAKYLTLGLLFVNVSIGGTLTPFAAPPVLMVASKWNWDVSFMLTHFGWRSISAIVISTIIISFFIKKDLVQLNTGEILKVKTKLPMWVILTHVVFLALIVFTHQNTIIFTGLFLFFLGLVTVTGEYQKQLKLKESLLVAFFLGGLVVLGGPQKWWLQPLVTSLSTYSLYIGSIVLTSFTDNAALTYLGSQVENLSDISKFALVAGSVVGGGMTVIANAPNPAGYSILNTSFGSQGISPLYLFLGALLPTVIAAVLFFPF